MDIKKINCTNIYPLSSNINQYICEIAINSYKNIKNREIVIVNDLKYRVIGNVNEVITDYIAFILERI